MGQLTGLDYAAVVAVAKWRGLDPEIMNEIKCLELGALAAFNDGDIESILHG